MKKETLVTDMFKINVQARLWHWATPVAQHHTTFEAFLAENEQNMDRLVESILGNTEEFDVSAVQVSDAVMGDYDLSKAKATILEYRDTVHAAKKKLSDDSVLEEEMSVILDDVLESCSKTMYLLKLS